MRNISRPWPFFAICIRSLTDYTEGSWNMSHRCCTGTKVIRKNNCESKKICEDKRKHVTMTGSESIKGVKPSVSLISLRRCRSSKGFAFKKVESNKRCQSETTPPRIDLCKSQSKRQSSHYRSALPLVPKKVYERILERPSGMACRQQNCP